MCWRHYQLVDVYFGIVYISNHMDENKDSLALFSRMYVIFLAFAYYFLRLYFCQYFFFKRSQFISHHDS